VAKKWLILGMAVSISTLMLGYSMSAMAESPAYDTFKQAWKQTKEADQMGGQVTVTLTDNGSRLMQINSAFQLDKPSNTANADVTLSSGAAKRDLTVYRQDGQVIVKPGDSDVYKVIEAMGQEKWHHSDGGDSEHAERAGHLVDMLAGHWRDYVTQQQQPDGTTRVSLHMSGNEVPFMVNTVGSFIIKKNGAAHHRNEQSAAAHNPFFSPELKPNLPKLSSDVKVQDIQLDAVVASGRISSESAVITVTGKDDAGASHTLTAKLTLELNGNGSSITKPAAIDLTGKQVETIQHKGSPFHRKP
jgi:hypothetical protein